MKDSNKEPRILVIVDKIFKQKIQIKAVKEGHTVSDIVRTLLLKWLNEK